jgi:hypothetical protein
MAFIKVLEMKMADFTYKYKISQRVNKVFCHENIRLFAWVFIFTRFYKIYLLV